MASEKLSQNEQAIKSTGNNSQKRTKKSLMMESKRFYDARTKLSQHMKESGQPESIQTVSGATAIPASSISLYESGDRLPNMENAITLANYYGVNVLWLLGQSDSPSVNESNQVVTKVTGLSEKAIRNLQTIRALAFTDSLNNILESDSFIRAIDEFNTACLVHKQNTETPAEASIADQAYRNAIKDTGGNVVDYVLLSKTTQAEMLLASSTQILGNLLRDILKGGK